jgi:hypothetical protein
VISGCNDSANNPHSASRQCSQLRREGANQSFTPIQPQRGTART